MQLRIFRVHLKCGIGGGTGTALTASRRKIRKRFSTDENTGFLVNTGQVASPSKRTFATPMGVFHKQILLTLPTSKRSLNRNISL
jgi:hypothetical protein